MEPADKKGNSLSRCSQKEEAALERQGRLRRNDRDILNGIP